MTSVDLSVEQLWWVRVSWLSALLIVLAGLLYVGPTRNEEAALLAAVGLLGIIAATVFIPLICSQRSNEPSD